MPPDLPALSARLREASGPYRVPPGDRRATTLYRCAVLNCEIAEAFGFAPEGYTRSDGDTFFNAPPVGSDPRSPGFRRPEPYTTSIDSIAALVRTVEPDLHVQVHVAPDGSAVVRSWKGDGPGLVSYGPTEALGRCLALVEWRIARGG